MTRSSLVGLIHDKTMKSPTVSHDNGEATTLMSTDADSLDGVGEMLHEIWAQVIEVIVGVTLLASQVGWIWPLPLFLIYCKYAHHHSLVVAKIRSMFIYESVCCEEFTAPPKGLEQCNTESYSCYKLYVEHDESCQNAWLSEPSYEPHSRASRRRALGGFEIEMDHGLL